MNEDLVDIIRTLACQVDYAIGVEVSSEKIANLMAVPWVLEAVEGQVLVNHLCESLLANALEEETDLDGTYSVSFSIPGQEERINLLVVQRE